jgi:DNA-binding transcriptional MocR family regulator
MVQKQYRITGATASTIAANIENAVISGQLLPGDRLPPVRQLALECGVSPATAAAAFRRLRERGLVHSDGRRGTRIVPPTGAGQAGLAAPVRSEAKLATHLSRVRPESSHRDGLRDLANGNPDPSLLPELSGALERLAGPPVLYGAEKEVGELVALAREDFARDGVDASSMTIVSGALDGVERLLTSELRAGDAVAMEDPGYSAAIDLVTSLRLVPVPCGLDREGMRPEALQEALRRGARAVLITPRAQNPTGAALTPARASELADVLGRHPSTLVVEDDHAGPISGAAVNLCGPDQPRWAVVRSVSKWLGPDLRLAVVAGERALVARVERRQELGQGWVSSLLQRAAAALWQQASSGHPSLLDRATETYRSRRRALLEALADNGVVATGHSGLNVWIPVREEVPVCEQIAAAGWAIRAGEGYRLRSSPAVRVTVSTLDKTEAPELAGAIAGAMRSSRRSRRPA